MSTPAPAPAPGAGRVAIRVLAALAALLLVALGLLRERPGELRGDEGTYVAMTQSLVADGDLRFDERDAARLAGRAGGAPPVILERTATGIHYSKPILYPLLAAPFYALLAERGMAVANLALLALALALAAAALGRREGGERAADLLALFVVASPVAPYLAWRMTESLQVALAAAGLALTLGSGLGPARGRALAGRALEARWAEPVGALLLGLLVGLRQPNVAVAAIPLGVALLERRPGRLARIALLVALGFAANALVTRAWTGAVDPYRAARTTFTAETGYPLGGDLAALARFESDESLATSTLGFVPEAEPRRSLYALFYFFAGRHTGLVACAPAALLLLLAAARGSDRTGRIALAGFAGAAAIYLVWWPTNYFGGEVAVGNRYLLAAMPALLFAPRALPSRRALAAGWVWALVLGVSALLSVARTRDLDSGSQNHAYAGIYRRLPYESVASNIEGRRDRYWSGDFVRFVDPYARVGPWSFELAAGDPAAELELATSWTGERIALWVTADVPRVELVASDWLARHTLRLGSGEAPLRQQVVLDLSPAWRVHRFWWPTPVPYRARLVRLTLSAPADESRPIAARLHYLGRRRIPDSGFAAEPIGLALPTEAVAGDEAAVEVRVVHRGDWPWEAEGPLPVALGARLERLDPEPGGALTEFRAPLPRDVQPGQRVDATLRIRWPKEPGRYRLVVDLVLEEVAWFSERGGAPLGESEVTVRPPG